jgi:hypothetical protein
MPATSAGMTAKMRCHLTGTRFSVKKRSAAQSQGVETGDRPTLGQAPLYERGWMTRCLTPTLAIGDLMFEVDHGLRQESLDARLHAGLPAREASEAASGLFRQEGLVPSLHARVHAEGARQTEA